MSALFSAEEPDRLRGKQHMKLWCDELAAWRQPDAFDQAMLGLRLGDKPQAVITTTPRPSKIIKTLSAGKDTIVTRGSTFDNMAHWRERSSNGSPRVTRAARSAAGIVRRNRRGDAGGSMDTGAARAPARRAGSGAEGIRRDRGCGRSAGALRSKSDECGIVVAAKAENGLFYVLADLTSQGETPGVWGARVGVAFRGFKANRVVAEINQGGDMVTEVLRQSEPNLPVRAVHATRGKFLGAEPIAAAYERGARVSLRDVHEAGRPTLRADPRFRSPRPGLLAGPRRRAGLGAGGPCSAWAAAAQGGCTSFGREPLVKSADQKAGRLFARMPPDHVIPGPASLRAVTKHKVAGHRVK